MYMCLLTYQHYRTILLVLLIWQKICIYYIIILTYLLYLHRLVCVKFASNGRFSFTCHTWIRHFRRNPLRNSVKNGIFYFAHNTEKSCCFAHFSRPLFMLRLVLNCDLWLCCRIVLASWVKSSLKWHGSFRSLKKRSKTQKQQMKVK